MNPIVVLDDWSLLLRSIFSFTCLASSCHYFYIFVRRPKRAPFLWVQHVQACRFLMESFKDRVGPGFSIYKGASSYYEPCVGPTDAGAPNWAHAPGNLE